MLRSVLLLLSMCFALNLGAKNIDSLQRVIADPKIDLLDRVASAKSLAEYHLSQKDTATAIELAVSLSESVTKKDNPFEYARWHEFSALIFTNSKLHNRTVGAYYRTAELYKEQDSIGHQFKVIRFLGEYYRKLNMMDSARIHFDECLGLAEELKDSVKLAQTYIGYGIISFEDSQYDEAMRLFDKSLEYSKAINNYTYWAQAIRFKGAASEKIGDLVQALEYHKQGLEVAKLSGNQSAIAYAYNAIGNDYWRLGNYSESKNYYMSSLEIKRVLKDERGIASSTFNLGTLSYFDGDYEGAIKYFTESLEIRQKYNQVRKIANATSALANTYLALGRIDEAGEKFEMAYHASKEMGNPKGMAIALNGMADIKEKKGDFTAATKDYQHALEILSEIGFRTIQTSCLSGIHRCYLANNQMDSAFYYAEKLIERLDKELEVNLALLSEEEKEMYFNAVGKMYNVLNNFAHISNNQNLEVNKLAYNKILSLKGLLLRGTTVMKNSILNSNDSELIDKYNQWIGLREQISDNYSKGKPSHELEVQARDLESELMALSQTFSEATLLKNSDWTTVQSNLGKKEIAIEFIRYSYQKEFTQNGTLVQMYGAYVLKNDGAPVFVPLFEGKKLENILGRYPGTRIGYIRELYGARENPSSQLYDLIWKPLEDHVAKVKKVYISPDGLLHKISFATLTNESGEYLSEKHALQFVSSTSSISNQGSEELSSTSSIGLFGGVDYNLDYDGFEVWSYLEGTMLETETIDSILRTNDIEVHSYTSASASEERFKKNSKELDLIHFATHGFFYSNDVSLLDAWVDTTEKDIQFRGDKNRGSAMSVFVKSENPLMRSGLVLAGGNRVWSTEASEEDGHDDGVLTAQEVAILDLRKTKLVVLSACETGLGDIKGSEGVYGLQRSFKMAGVKYIIMSLWQVPDKETAEFMTSFYKNLTKTNDIKKSFSMTQAEMRNKYDPYYWAAFVLVE